jgi:serine phosphatase RsbU (regulator of sigma subunit)
VVARDGESLFTGGVPEATGATLEGLLQALGGAQSLGCRELIDRLMAAALGFTGGAPQPDDITMVAPRPDA